MNLRATNSACALCGKPYRSCPHQWHKPFSEWPKSMLSFLINQVRS